VNKVLVIDLTTEKYHTDNISEEVMDAFLGGRGLGAYLLYNYLTPGVAPLSPENVLIFTAGPLQGTTSYYSAKTVLTTKSPLTGIYLFSVASGKFGHQIAKAGYSSIMIKGASARPTYVMVDDNRVAFSNAEEFWGMGTVASHDAMLADSGLDNGACACIGPAGEQLNTLAAIATEGEKARIFGRGGSGAVMGAKKLKGIVLRGNNDVHIVDSKSFASGKRAIRDIIKEEPEWVEMQRRFGTGSDMVAMNQLGILPTHNWQSGTFDHVDTIALTEIENEWPRKNVACGPYCISPCSHVAEIDRGPWEGARTEGPEYETLYAFGSNCGVDRFDAIVAAEEICDQYGIDTISCGATIAFAMECYERGLITKAETGGIELRFGNAEGMVRLVRMIAKMEGIGRVLSQGTRTASEAIEGSKDFAMQSKGMEFGGYECRGMWGQALQFAINSRGGDHHGYGLPARTPEDWEHGTQIEGKGALVKNGTIQRILIDSAVVCSFPRRKIGTQSIVSMINSVTGKNFSTDDIQTIGLRVATIERMFNIREGLGREDDYLPGRLLTDPLPEGPRKGSTVPIDELLNEGYRSFGWHEETGVPLKESVELLGLNRI